MNKLAQALVATMAAATAATAPVQAQSCREAIKPFDPAMPNTQRMLKDCEKGKITPQRAQEIARESLQGWCEVNYPQGYPSSHVPKSCGGEGPERSSR